MQRALLLASLAALFAAPALLSPWGLSQLTFVAIYVIAGTGLMLLAGYAGQLSLCHAAFIGVGAYAEAILQQHGWPMFASLPAAALLAAATGVLAAVPARRLGGIYLAIATLSFGFIVQEAFVRWESVTGGNTGRVVAALDAGTLYWLALGLALGALWMLGRVLASRHGRALTALREDATAAGVIGVALPRLKLIAFALAAALGGLAGGLYAHQLRFVSPEQFDWVMSIELLMMLVIGGLATRAGIVFGAAFLIALPQAIALLRDALGWDTPPAGIELFAFGCVLVLALRFFPAGLVGSLHRLRSL
jgi:branched-chain amino acid transport system permease protein